MKRTVKSMLIFLMVMSLFTGCNSVPSDEIKQPSTKNEMNTSSLQEEKEEKEEKEEREEKENIALEKDTSAEVEIAVLVNDMFTKRDYEIEYSEKDAILIQLDVQARVQPLAPQTACPVLYRLAGL